MFEVLVNIQNVAVLDTLKSYFKVGTIYTSGTKATYRVQALKDLKVIIAHFSTYPLLSSKVVTYNLWCSVVELMIDKQHLITETWDHILNVYASLGRGANAAVLKAYPNIKPLTLPEYTPTVSTQTLNLWWLSGYLTLYCTFTLNIRASGWKENIYQKYVHRLDISFDVSALKLAVIIASYFSASCYTRKDQTRVDVSIMSLESCLKVVEFLDEHPLQSDKAAEYAVWKRFVEMHDMDAFNDTPLTDEDTAHRYMKLITKLGNVKLGQ